MTRNEATDPTATTIREVTRKAFAIWSNPLTQRIVAAAIFVGAVAVDEWMLLDAGPAKSEDEQEVEAIAAVLRARGGNGSSLAAAKALHKARLSGFAPRHRSINIQETLRRADEAHNIRAEEREKNRNAQR